MERVRIARSPGGYHGVRAKEERGGFTSLIPYTALYANYHHVHALCANHPSICFHICSRSPFSPPSASFSHSHLCPSLSFSPSNVPTRFIHKYTDDQRPFLRFGPISTDVSHYSRSPHFISASGQTRARFFPRLGPRLLGQTRGNLFSISTMTSCSYRTQLFHPNCGIQYFLTLFRLTFFCSFPVSLSLSRLSCTSRAQLHHGFYLSLANTSFHKTRSKLLSPHPIRVKRANVSENPTKSMFLSSNISKPTRTFQFAYHILTI